MKASQGARTPRGQRWGQSCASCPLGHQSASGSEAPLCAADTPPSQSRLRAGPQAGASEHDPHELSANPCTDRVQGPRLLHHVLQTRGEPQDLLTTAPSRAQPPKREAANHSGRLTANSIHRHTSSLTPATFQWSLHPTAHGYSPQGSLWMAWPSPNRRPSTAKAYALSPHRSNQPRKAAPAHPHRDSTGAPGDGQHVNKRHHDRFTAERTGAPESRAFPKI